MAIIKLAPAKNSEPEGNMSTFPGTMTGLMAVDPDMASEVVSGEDGGLLLSQYIEKKGLGCLGTKAEKYDRMPYNIKLIAGSDSDNMSVNPFEDKEAIWYVSAAAPDAKIDFGLSKEVTLDEFKEAINNGTATSLLQPVAVQVGDVFDVKAGTVFRLGEGVTVIDMQKTVADPEYTAEDIFNSLILKPVTRDPHENEWLADGSASYECLGKNDVLDADLYALNGRMDMHTDGDSFKALVFTEGTAVIDTEGTTLHAKANDAFFVEAGTHPFQITGNCKFIAVTLV